jgi:preprotein translocase subunit SecF
MHIFPVGKTFDFMGARRALVIASIAIIAASLLALVKPGPLMGTDFHGGTELEVAFKKRVQTGQLRAIVSRAGFLAPSVVKVEDKKNPYRFLVRVDDVSTIGAKKRAEIEQKLCYGVSAPTAECPEEKLADEIKFSPGGDKITLRFRGAPDLDWVRKQAESIPGIDLREGENNPLIQNVRANRVEIQLKSKGDQLLDAMRAKLGVDTVPAQPLRVEWIGPKAGAQLRDAALKSISIAIVFIMVYIAFRFDMRFAPGAVISMAHDAVAVIGVLILMQRLTHRLEFNLASVAAILTIVGYSVNDTVVVYDRVRENLGRLRGVSFDQLINISISEMFSRTILTSATTVFSLSAFLIFGSGPLEEFAFTLIIGVIFGTYSSIYIALPVTEWFDRVVFKKPAPGAKGIKGPAPATP